MTDNAVVLAGTLAYRGRRRHKGGGTIEVTVGARTIPVFVPNVANDVWEALGTRGQPIRIVGKAGGLGRLPLVIAESVTLGTNAAPTNTVTITGAVSFQRGNGLGFISTSDVSDELDHLFQSADGPDITLGQVMIYADGELDLEAYDGDEVTVHGIMRDYDFGERPGAVPMVRTVETS